MSDKTGDSPIDSSINSSTGSSIDDDRFCELEDRRALDEALGHDEREFLLAHDSSGPEYAAERALWEALAELDAPAELDEHDRELARRALADFKKRRRRPWRRRALAGALVAASALLWFGLQPGDAVLGARVSQGALLQREFAETTSSASILREGSSVPTGVALRVNEDPSCVARGREREPELCGALGAELSLDPSGETVVLASGALEVSAGFATKTAHGVITTERGRYRVEAAAGRGPVTVTALRGPVSVATRQGGVRLETGEQRTFGLEQRVAAVSNSDPEDRRRVSPLADAERASDDELSGETEAAPVETTPRADAKAPRPASERLSASEMLAKARELRGAGKLRKAASVYSELARVYPSSPEAHAAAVSLGQVQVQRGQLRRALRAFDRYLRRGGPLAEEAHWGKVQTLHALGETDKRDAAVAAFASAHPRSVYLARARGLAKEDPTP